MWKFMLPALVLTAVVAGGLLFFQTLSRHGSTGRIEGFEPKEDAIVPDFELIRMDGDPVNFSDLNYKLVLVNFWATWCTACLIEMPSIIELEQRFAKDGFGVIFINVDENPESVVPPMLERLKLSIDVFIDVDQKLSELFHVHAIPLTAILTKERKILYIQPGERDWYADEVKAKINSWLQ